AGDHHGLDSHGAERSEPVAYAALHDVLEVDDSERSRTLRYNERRAALARNAIDLLPEVDGNRNVLLRQISLDGVRGAFADAAPVQIDPRHARLGREGDECGFVRGQFTSSNAVLLLCEHDDRTAFRGFVGQRGKLRGVSEERIADAWRGAELRRLAV